MSKVFSQINLSKGQHRSIFVTLAVIVFSGMVYLPMACSKVDDAIDSAISFDGVFSSSDGWEVDLEGSSAKVTKVGTARGNTGVGVGDYTMTGMTRSGDNSWKGTVLDENFENSLSGTATIVNGVLTIKPTGSTSYTFTKKSTGSTGTGTVTGTATGKDTLMDKYVDGSKGDKKSYYYTIGAGVKKLEIITTEGTAEGKSANYNTADMFVSIGSSTPTVVSSPYSWTADCASVNINRISEYCSYSNPATGTKYNILVYGHSTFFISRLLVIATK